MEVSFNNKRIIISGELTLTPAFYADINSMKKWSPPYNEILITDEEKNIIISELTKVSKWKQLKIYFE
jgi:hypothetical protein